jgi:hypothetical protein
MTAAQTTDKPVDFSAGFSFVVDGICGAAGLAVFAGHQ